MTGFDGEIALLKMVRAHLCVNGKNTNAKSSFDETVSSLQETALTAYYNMQNAFAPKAYATLAA
jgi:hypothetical protein